MGISEISIADILRLIAKDVRRLQAELDKERWIPVSEIGNLSNNADWRLFIDMTLRKPVPDLRYVSRINVNQIIKANHFTHWKPIILPKNCYSFG